MKQQLMGVTCALAMGLVSSVAGATFSGAPLIAWAGYYNQSSGLVLAGPGCRNDVDQMPSGRKFACGQPVVTKTATGRYSVKVWNARPFPTIANDSGYQVFVQTIGGKAHCFEESTTWELAPPYELTSKVRCVAPSSNSSTNTDVDAQFAWSYRADSGDYPQSQPYNSNHAYARITGSTGAIVADQSFDAAHFDGAGIVGARTATGRYRVTFKEAERHRHSHRRRLPEQRDRAEDLQRRLERELPPQRLHAVQLGAGRHRGQHGRRALLRSRRERTRHRFSSVHRR